MKTNQTMDPATTTVTFDNEDEVVIHRGEQIVISTYGGGYNGALRLTSEEAHALGAILQDS